MQFRFAWLYIGKDFCYSIFYRKGPITYTVVISFQLVCFNNVILEKRVFDWKNFTVFEHRITLRFMNNERSITW